MKRRLAALAPVLAALMAGCSTVGYKCDKPLACNPVRHNYQAATADSGWAGWQAGHALVGAKGQPSRQQLVQSAASGVDAGTPMVPTGDALNGPAYTPPRPWRVWLAPTSRDDGTLQSGSYIWFVTPGHWNYLGRQWKAPPQSVNEDDSGGGDGTLGPVAPDSLGFTPGRSLAPKGVLNNITQPGDYDVNGTSN